MLLRPTILPAVALAALFAVTAMAAAGPAIDTGKSSVVATFRQENVPVDSPFTSFSGRIDYNATAPARSTATIEVQTASLDLGSAEYNHEASGRNWFDSAAYPKAVFVSTGIKPVDPTHFNATGNLTLKGKTVPVNVPVTLVRSGTALAFDGYFDISRSTFNIGDAQWKDVVDDVVRVKFHLVQ